MTTRTPMTLCPACGAPRDAATDPTDTDQAASPGDFSVCIECAALQVFAADLALRRPTEAEAAEAALLPGVQALQRAARELGALRAVIPASLRSRTDGSGSTMNCYQLPDTPTVINFSGGRSSGYMLRKILDHYEDRLPGHVRVAFTNTEKSERRRLSSSRSAANAGVCRSRGWNTATTPPRPAGTVTHATATPS